MNFAQSITGDVDGASMRKPFLWIVYDITNILYYGLYNYNVSGKGDFLEEDDTEIDSEDSYSNLNSRGSSTWCS